MTASAKARDHFGHGGAGAQIKLTQMTHDLHVGEVLLSYRRRGYDLRRWVGEDYFPTTWPLRERPDALLIDERGQFSRVIEYGGDYSADRLLKLHRAVARIDLAYEIW